MDEFGKLPLNVRKALTKYSLEWTDIYTDYLKR